MDTGKIKSVLARTPGLSAWFLNRVDGEALTMIRLPGLVSMQNGSLVRRANPYPREVIRAPGEELWITAFVRFEQDGKTFLGEAFGQFLSDDEAEVRKVLDGLIAAARLQPNPVFSLPGSGLVYPEPALADPEVVRASIPEILALAQGFDDKLLQQAGREPMIETSNLEVFLRRSHNEFETSTGIRLRYESTRTDAEVCFLARDGESVSEFTARPHARRLADLEIGRLVAESAECARSTLRAGSPPAWSGPVVLLGEAAANFLSLEGGPLLFHCSGRTVYEKNSRYRKGEPVSGDQPMKGDPVTIASDPMIPFGVRSAPLSADDGSPARRAVLVNEGRFDELVGHRKYLEFMGLPAKGIAPSGPIGNTVVTPGRWRRDDLLNSGKVVTVRAFSDFQTDPTTGDFVCEVRLGEVRENGKITSFKGGLLIGNWFAALADANYAAETIRDDGYYGPAAVRFNNLTIAG